MKILMPLCVAATAGVGLWMFHSHPQILLVSEVLDAPNTYVGKTVKVSGEVVHNLGLFGVGGFLLTDGPAQLAVLTTEGVPRKGQQVEVEGTFQVALSIGTAEYAVIIVGEDVK